MKERPILFSGPMVRAILNGRKTQTRRVVKPQSSVDVLSNGAVTIEGWVPELRCQFGAVGDRLWVRETFGPCAGGIVYRADGGTVCPDGWKWRPSIHMPRWASRLTLEITAIRVERLQEISEDDAVAEGCEEAYLEHTEDCRSEHCALAGGVDDCCGYLISAKLQYKALWQSIYGRGSWDANPWVFVIEFRKVEEVK